MDISDLQPGTHRVRVTGRTSDAYFSNTTSFSITIPATPEIVIH
jgi:hypothetical protein